MVTPETERRLAEILAPMDARHFQDDCWLLDDKCCVRAWSDIRRAWPELVGWLETLHGKDFWLTLPRSYRLVFALVADQHRHDQEEVRVRSVRTLELLVKAVDAEKVAAIKRGRRGAS